MLRRRIAGGGRATLCATQFARSRTKTTKLHYEIETKFFAARLILDEEVRFGVGMQ